MKPDSRAWFCFKSPCRFLRKSRYWSVSVELIKLNNHEMSLLTFEKYQKCMRSRPLPSKSLAVLWRDSLRQKSTNIWWAFSAQPNPALPLFSLPSEVGLRFCFANEEPETDGSGDWGIRIERHRPCVFTCHSLPLSQQFSIIVIRISRRQHRIHGQELLMSNNCFLPLVNAEKEDTPGHWGCQDFRTAVLWDC